MAEKHQAQASRLNAGKINERIEDIHWEVSRVERRVEQVAEETHEDSRRNMSDISFEFVRINREQRDTERTLKEMQQEIDELKEKISSILKSTSKEESKD